MGVPEGVPEGRCGYTLDEEDIGLARESTVDIQEWHRRAEAVCCWREVWDDAETDRCIWHAEIEGKAIENLPEVKGEDRLDGAFLRKLAPKDFDPVDPESVTKDTLYPAIPESALDNPDPPTLDFEAVNLSHADLGNANIRNSTLRGADLTKTDLGGANLQDTDLREVRLHEADLSRALLQNANLEEAQLVDANLEHSNLSGATFDNARLRSANLVSISCPFSSFEDADLWDADLHAARLSNANFRGAGLGSTDLHNSNFSSSDLSQAQIPQSDLSSADLTDAELEETILRESDLHDATLRLARLSHANLSGANLSETNLENAELEQADLRDCTLKNTNLTLATLPAANLEHTSLERADIRDADLTDAELYETHFLDVRLNEGTTFVATEDPRCVYERRADQEVSTDDPAVAQFLPAALARFWTRRHTDRDDLTKAVRVYRSIQRILRQNSLPGEAPAHYVREKHTRRKQALAEGDYSRWFRLSAARWTTLYGESPWRAVYTSLGIILLFGVLYPLLGGVTVETAPPTHDFFEPLTGVSLPPPIETLLVNLYFSAVTFTTLGYGDIQPASPGSQTLAAVESLVGAAMIALLVALLGRRLMR